MNAAVVVFPGSNREHDVAFALELASGKKPTLVWHADTALPRGTDLVVLPGGFSDGDYLRCGAIAARAPIMNAVRTHAACGGLVLGICNGFQILCESGLLPGVLMRNKDRRFACKIAHLKVERADTSFTHGYRAGQVIAIPCAHGEGNYIVDTETLAQIEGQGQVAFRYCSASGEVGPAFNHNGSTNSIAGVFSAGFNVLGMMPHPENHVDARVGPTDGYALFAGAVGALAKVA